jgi:hypothetical protein
MMASSFRVLPRPRSWTRSVELGFLILPLLLAVLFFALIMGG